MASWIGVFGILKVVERRQPNADLVCANSFRDSLDDL